MGYLKEGTGLKQVYWPEENKYFQVGGIVKSITVSMEVGQMAMVPWALIEFTDRKSHLVNLALCEGVILEKENNG